MIDHRLTTVIYIRKFYLKGVISLTMNERFVADGGFVGK
jgi:hypothetical protein